MTDTVASKALTDSLMGVIRQQRHYGTRVIISTQEPSISPKLIDLCSITIMHRFSSPEWLDVLQRHILVSDEEGDRGNKVGLLREIMRLKTGEALVFAPSAMVGANDERKNGADALLKMRMRKRVTWDGGRSMVCI
jgi:DNA helicase HerA-like ATPase